MWSIPWFSYSSFCTCPEIQSLSKCLSLSEPRTCQNPKYSCTLEYPWQCAIQVQPTLIPPHIPRRWAATSLQESWNCSLHKAQSTALGIQGRKPGNAVYLQVSHSGLSCPAQLHTASPGKFYPPQGRRNIQFCFELSAHAVVGKQLQQFPGFQSLVSGHYHEVLSLLGHVREQGYEFKKDIINHVIIVLYS